MTLSIEKPSFRLSPRPVSAQVTVLPSCAPCPAPGRASVPLYWGAALGRGAERQHRRQRRLQRARVIAALVVLGARSPHGVARHSTEARLPLGRAGVVTRLMANARAGMSQGGSLGLGGTPRPRPPQHPAVGACSASPGEHHLPGGSREAASLLPLNKRNK